MIRKPAHITLSNNVVMPQLGLGTWQMRDASLIAKAIKLGYRLIDTAAVYGNEESVGQAIKASGVARSDLFITTKLWNSDQGSGAVKAFNKSLERLELSYIDLYLIHWPAPATGKYIETWKILENLYKQKRVRAIGVSNFTSQHLETLMANSSIIPMINQIELHPHFQQVATVDFCKSHNIKIEAYSPLGGSHSSVLNEIILKDLAQKHNVSPAQIVLRWHIQNGFVVIPKASQIDHIKQNADIFNFMLNQEDMKSITTLETGKKRLPNPDTFNSGIKTGVVQLAHRLKIIRTGKEK